MIFLLCLFLALSPLIVDALLITEVQIEGERSDDCYILIYNPSLKEKNLEGYRIRKRTSTGSESSVRVIPSGITIKEGDYLLWASSRNKNFPEKIDADIQSTQYLSRNNSIAVFDNEGNILDSLGWGDGDNQYKENYIFPFNPEKGQVIRRKKIDGEYKNTQNNADDFFLYPPPESPLKIQKTYTEPRKEEKGNPYLIAFFSSAFLGFLILFLKKWQDTVTSKT